MISRHSSISIATSMGLHVLIVLLVVSGVLQHTHKEIEIPPVQIELIPPKKLEPPPPPKPEPKKPELPKPPKPEPVRPEPPKVVETKPEPPKPEPAKVATPAPEPTPKPTPAPVPTPAPPPEALAKPAPPPAPAATKSSSGSSAHYVGSCEAPYPSMSKRLNEKGTVVVKVLVKSDGTAGDVELKSSSGYPRLDQAWLETIKNCRFTPSIGGDGKPMDEWFSAPHTFKLN